MRAREVPEPERLNSAESHRGFGTRRSFSYQKVKVVLALLIGGLIFASIFNNNKKPQDLNVYLKTILLLHMMKHSSQEMETVLL